MQLRNLPKGAIFETRDGIRAVKSEYYYGGGGKNDQCQCILLESGEYAHFVERDREEVREIDLLTLLRQHAEMTRLFHAVRTDSNAEVWEERGRALERAEIADMLRRDGEQLAGLAPRNVNDTLQCAADRVEQRGPFSVLLPADSVAAEIAVLRGLLKDVCEAGEYEIGNAIREARKHLAKEK